MRLSARFWPILFPGVVAFGMALFMSAVITLVNAGFDKAYWTRWGRAFLIAFPLAWAAAVFWAPIAFKITARFVTPAMPGAKPPG